MRTIVEQVIAELAAVRYPTTHTPMVTEATAKRLAEALASAGLLRADEVDEGQS